MTRPIEALARRIHADYSVAEHDVTIEQLAVAYNESWQRIHDALDVLQILRAFPKFPRIPITYFPVPEPQAGDIPEEKPAEEEPYDPIPENMPII